MHLPTPSEPITPSQVWWSEVRIHVCDALLDNIYIRLGTTLYRKNCWYSAGAEGEVGPIIPVKAHQVIFMITDLSKVVLLMWFSVFLVLVSLSVLFSHSVCLDDFYLGLGS